MRIPLDYYRILGLPIQGSHEQLQQAYRDRAVQLPRREYSAAAIRARKQLLEEAYAVLSNPEQRSRYDINYFAHTYERRAQDASEPTAEKRLELLPAAVALHTPSIEIPDEQFAGALLILQELGEYELVLKLGRPYLSISTTSNEQRSEPDLALSDIVLTLTLAYLELGREQWQQGQYENATTSLGNGQEILLRAGLFPSIQGEIQADLYKLRPYHILELLALPEENVVQRHQGLQLLEKLLQERGGIDGTGDDGSGLSLDDFLRFIQQLRSYLTVAEQQSLFEAEGQRPSAVATYLAAYALLAQGFAQCMPALIAHTKLLLLHLGNRQDLHLEQAVCSLLLGQTEEASLALELSHEYETLAFIREQSLGAPDLLPGLCLYTERWLQLEVFPHFRDLAEQKASLKGYFADQQVQAYLEALPTETEAIVTPQLPDKARSLDSTYHTADVVGSDTSSHSSTAISTSNGVVMVPDAESIAMIADTNTPAQNQPKRSRRRTRKQVNSLNGVRSKAKLTRAGLLVLAGVVSIVFLGFLLSRTYSWLKQTSPMPPGQKEQPKVPAPLPSPSPVNQRPSPTPTIKPPLAPVLTQKTAEQVIQTWLSTKAAAFGSGHAVDRLNQILVGPALSQWQELAQTDKTDKLYRQYKHSLKVDSVATSQADPNQAQVEATINEVAQVYEDGQLNQDSSYNDQNLRVRYHLIRQGDQWRINDMAVLK